MCENCGWADTLDDIDELLNDKRANFANDFLTSVQKWVKEKEHVTDKQLSGINNVRSAAFKSKER